MILAQRSTSLIEWGWILDHLDDIWARTIEHLQLTSLPIGIGVVISLGLAVVSLRWPRSFGPIVGFGGVLYTIPSLAAFALLLPIFGLSRTPVVIALVSYTILILVRNMVTGIRGVPDEVKEAARAMGYRPHQVFLRVEIPLALPVILAGIRIATVTVVGLVTVSSLLGYGGLGFFILNGFRRSIVFPTEIIVGAVLSVVLAAILDAMLMAVGRLLTPWSSRARAVG